MGHIHIHGPEKDLGYYILPPKEIGPPNLEQRKGRTYLSE